MSAFWGGYEGLISQRRPAAAVLLFHSHPRVRSLSTFMLMGRTSTARFCCRARVGARTVACLLPVSDRGSFEKEADRWAFRVSGKPPKCDRRGHPSSTRTRPESQILSDYPSVQVLPGLSTPLIPVFTKIVVVKTRSETVAVPKHY